LFAYFLYFNQKLGPKVKDRGDKGATIANSKEHRVELEFLLAATLFRCGATRPAETASSKRQRKYREVFLDTSIHRGAVSAEQPQKPVGHHCAGRNRCSIGIGAIAERKRVGETTLILVQKAETKERPAPSWRRPKSREKRIIPAFPCSV
jgi:hypothetical protein